jgi:hypothetical protein
VIFDKGAKNIQKRQYLQQVVLRKLLSTCRRLKQDLYLSPCVKIKSKWIKDFNVRPETLKVLHENTEKTLEDITIHNYFLNRTPIAWEIRIGMDKWDCIKLNSFCTSKKKTTNYQNQETTQRMGENS